MAAARPRFRGSQVGLAGESRSRGGYGLRWWAWAALRGDFPRFPGQTGQGACSLAVAGNELVDVRRRGKITEKARDGRGRDAIWEIPVETVMAAQSDLVQPVARFNPRLVKMAPAGERPED